MSMRTALTGLSASQTELSTIANNIANAATTGFKRSRTEFADLFSFDASGKTPGTGVRVAGVTQQMKQGGLEFTGNNLDLAINGSFWVGAAAGALISVPLLDPALVGPDTGWRVAFGSGAVLFCSLALANEVFKSGAVKAEGLADMAKAAIQKKMHMDIASNISHLPVRTLLVRGGLFFGWMIAFLTSMALIGLIPTVPIFIIALMRLEARESWRIVLPMAAVMCVFIYILFDQLLAIPWPPSVLGDVFPSLRGVVPSV